MAAKRKSSRSTKKAAKKPMSRMAKRSPMKAKARKGSKMTSKKSSSSMKMTRTIPPITSVNKPYTKGQLFTTLSGRTGIARKEIAGLFDELKAIIGAHVKKQGPGHFTLPGLVKLTIVHKPATKARKGINPFTGEEMMFKAKPARNVVKARALKQLKEMV